MRRNMVIGTMVLFTGFCSAANAQSASDSVLPPASLQQCVEYALQHQPVLKQSQLDEEITERTIRSKLSDWYPQLQMGYNLQHNFQLQTSVFQGVPTHIGVKNTSGINFSLNQTIFNQDVLLASRTARDVRKQASQSTASMQIDVTLAVSKAFYNVLLAQQQVALVGEDITRLTRSLQDARNQYEAGIVDKTDYKRAQVSLNNALLHKKQYEEQLTASYAVLKEQMGYPGASGLELVYDSLELEQRLYMDTLARADYGNRIEYQLLETQKSLMQANLRYYKWSYLPSLSVVGAYNLNYFNNQFSKLYNQNYPNSYAGLSLAFPLFQGTKRVQQVKQAGLELDRLEYDFTTLRNAIDREYATALAAYKSNLADYITMRDNLALAQDVYNTIRLQYKAGIKTFLDVIIAETDLRTTQVSYLDALYSALSSKLDVQKALGTLNNSLK